MAWRDEAAAELPDPQPSEPPALRSEILDELADHLVCAADRERLRGGEESEIAGRVRERFGDPARIARRLWFDAMKERLMAQRITIAVAVTLGLAAVVSCGVLWSSVRQTRELLADALAQNQAQTEKTNAALLARIEELSKSNEQMSSFAMEWNPVRVKLLRGEDGLEPAVGYTATLTGHLYKGGERSTVEKTADASGIVDFGRVQPGRYELTVATPWSAYRQLTIHVVPGESVEETILCPDKEILKTDVRMEVAWPEGLPETINAVVVRMYGPTLKFSGEERWLLHGAENRYLLLRRNGPLQELSEERIQPRAALAPGIRGAKSLHFAAPDSPFTWQTGTYTVYDIHLLSLLPVDGNEPDVRLYAAAAGMPLPVASRALRGDQAAVFIASAETDPEPDSRTRRSVTDADTDSIELPERLVYVPDAQPPNLWRIELPEVLVEDARERLKRFEAWRAEWEKQQETGVGATESARTDRCELSK